MVDIEIVLCNAAKNGVIEIVKMYINWGLQTLIKPCFMQF